MLNPSRLIPLAFFYPIGNTPAVCLTQSLPPDQDATLLLLGCGDVRNILYTLYADLGADTRSWDFTACDIEPEIIARNVLLLSLLLDDTDGIHVERIWNIYYHVLIDDNSLGLLRNQASKLLRVASTVDTWNQSTYGRCLRFADSESFSLATQSWRFYAIGPDSPGGSFQDQQNQLNSSACKAREIQEDMVGDDANISGIRSAAPCAFSALDELPTLYRNFWKDGMTGPCRPPKQTRQQNLNPMFGTSDARRVLHYGTEPLLGFHLAPAYAPLSHQSPLKPSGFNPTVGNSAYRTAIEAFRAYGEALRRSAARVVVRYVCADALALCHTLQDWRAGGSGQTPSWYRSPYTFKPLVLDAKEYSVMRDTEEAAPAAFDVVDTSNLADHFGALNFLVAVAPLLKPRRTSTVSTELLVHREGDTQRFTAGLVSGDLPTVALLLGLSPIQYWTGATSTSMFEEGMLNPNSREMPGHTQSRFVVHWKYISPATSSTARSPLIFDPEQLAGLLYGMYLSMFQDEARQSVFKAMYNGRLDGAQAQYTRASFVAILGLIYKSDVVPWEDFMNRLCCMIVEDETLDMGQPYREEMLMHLKTFGLCDAGSSMVGLPSRSITRPPETWSALPSAVCLTLRIPHNRLSALKGLSHRDGSPILHIVLGDYGRDEGYHIFSNVQLGFGTLQPIGDPGSEDYTLQVTDEDKHGWNGDSALIASIMAPAWMLFGDNGALRQITLALKHTGAALSRFGRKLGIDLIIHQSAVGNQDAFITKFRPNICRAATLSGLQAIDAPPKASTAPALLEDMVSHCRLDIQSQFQVSLVEKDPIIHQVTAHVDILPGMLQDTLRAGSAVQTSQVSATEISISFPKGNLITALQFPFPIDMTGSKSRIARKSSYIEFIATVAPRSVLARLPDVVYPTMIERGVPTVYNPHYIHLDQMPVVDLRDPANLKWLEFHLGGMFSARERKEQGRQMAGSPSDKDTRANFKHSLLTIFAHFTGIMGAQPVSACGLNHPEKGGVHAVIFPAQLRLDPSNQTVVMDAAILPLTAKAMPELAPELARLALNEIKTVNVDDEELLLWKHVLPAMAERCRRWKHLASCEYARAKRIPVAVAMGEMVLCSCGKGKFPEGYRVSSAASWNLAAKHATRVAIPLCFPVPFVDKPFRPMDESLDKPGPSGVAEKAKAALESKKGSCFTCGKAATTQAPNLRCGRCKVAEYCSKECQKSDWTEGMHKIICGVMQMGI